MTLSPQVQRMVAEVAQLRTAFELANAHLVSDIEDECHLVLCDGTWWRDTRPMVSHDEHCPAVVDMASRALAWGIECGLLITHPHHPHLVRITHLD